MRQAAANVYATNLASEEVGSTCQTLLPAFFADPDEQVRVAATSGLKHLAELTTMQQEQLLTAFLGAEPGLKEFDDPLRALEKSLMRLPDLVCKMLEDSLSRLVENDAKVSEPRSHSLERRIPGLVLRLYAQTDDEGIRRRCLDMLDRIASRETSDIAEHLDKVER